MDTSIKHYNGTLWRSRPAKPGNDSFFHSAFGAKTEEGTVYFDKYSKFRRMRWAGFLAYFENERMPRPLADVLRKCLSAHDKYQHASIDDADTVWRYVTDIINGAQVVNKEELHILATLENVKIVMLPISEQDRAVVVKPNPDILGSYRNLPGNIKEVVLCLKEDTFFRMEPANEDPDSTYTSSKTKRTDSSRYKKSRGNAGSKGVEYQVNLLTLVILNALRNSLPQWNLSTENEEAGKFDDIVMEYSEGTVLIQSKHKDNDKKRITLEELTSTNSKRDDFSLPKYFLSFQMVKTTFNVKNVIICTNASVHEEALEYLDRHDAISGSLLFHQEGQCSFHTPKKKIVQELKEKTILYYHLNFRDKGVKESVITDENLEAFLELLQIYFNYPSVKRLEKIIENSLSAINFRSNSQEKISHLEIYSKVKDWFQNDGGFYFTNTNAEVMFLEIWTDKYCHNLENYNVSFRRNLDLYGLPQTFYVAAPLRHLLQVIKIYQSIRDAKTATLIIIPDDDVDIQRLKVQTFIEISRYVYLIIIRPKIVEEPLTLEIYGGLSDILTQHKYKKIILVAEDNTLLQRIGLDDIVPIDGSVAFQDFSSVCQKRLLREKNIVFQGVKVSLEETLNTQNVDYSKILNQDIMEMLIVGEQVKVGAPIVNLNKYVKRHYVSRIFVREVNKTEEYNEGDISTSEEVSDLSKKLVQAQRLENEDREYEEANYEKEEMFSEDSIYDVHEKLVIVADDAGMGKTTVLTKLAMTIKESNPDLWVIMIELNDYTKIFSECLSEGKESINITELLGSKTETEFTNYLEERVFTIDQKVVMMLDGIDEISPDYTNLVLGMVKTCQEKSNFCKIFVTTRSHMAVELEAVFKVKPFVLQPFLEKNQLDFLTSYWCYNLELRDDASKEKCKRFAEHLIKKISWSNLDSNKDINFASIPLHITMAAEIFQEKTRLDESIECRGCKEYILGDEVEPSFTQTMNVRILYDLFLKRKRDIFIDKGNPTGNPIAKEALTKEFGDCLVYHRSFALEVILGEDKLLHFPEYKCRDGNTETNLLKIGIVQQFGDKFHFVHRTFADYFLAEILQAQLQHNRRIEFHVVFLDTILIQPQYNTTRVFLDSFIRKTVDSLPCDIFEKYQSFNQKRSLKHLMSRSKLLHVLAEEGCIAILQLILKCIDFKNIKNVEIRIKDRYESDAIEPSICGNTLKVLQHLTEQAGLNIKDENGRTPLHCAARKGDIEMMKYLIEHGADVHSRNDFGDTIIQVATKYGLFNTVQCLVVDYGMDANDLNDKGYTVLHIASKHGHVDIAKFLLEQGADSSAATNDGYTALHLAARFGHVTTVKFLVEFGLSYTVTNKDGRTLLNSASARGHLETVKYLLQLGMDYGIMEIKCKFGNTPLQVAAYFGRLETIKFLVEQGAKFNVSDKKGRTPLHSASRNGHLKTVQFLVELGVDPEIRDKDGYTALHFAAGFGHLDIVKLFVEQGLDFSVTNRNGDTLLHSASANGNMEIVKYLLELGIDSSIKDKYGCTALHIAVNFNRLQIVKCLVESGVNLDVANKNQSLLYAASSKGHLEIFKFLVEHCNPVSKNKKKPCRTPLHVASANGHLETAKFLLHLDVDNEASDRYGFTPLHLAARSGYLNVVKLFVGHGLNFNVTNNNGDTLLHSASANRHLEVVKYLLELGMDSTTKNNHGNTVLHIATNFGWLDVVKYFVEFGHDINVTNNIGYTPLHSACSKGHLEIIKYLLHLDVDYNARDHKGYTVLHTAACFNQLNTIKLLVDCGFNYKVTNNEGRTLLHSASATGGLETVKFLYELGIDINAKDKDGCTAMQTAVYFGRKKVYDFFIKCGHDCKR